MIAGRIRDLYFAHKREVILGIIIFLASLLSFNLGILASRKYIHSPIVIEKCSEV